MRKFLSLLLSVIFCLSASGCFFNPASILSSANKEDETEEITVATIANNADGYIGSDYSSVVSKLERCGFTNIETVEISDLDAQSEKDDGKVSEISIDGSSDFNADDTFEKDVPVVITYHTFMKIQTPLSDGDIQDMDYTEIEKLFSETGFINVQAEEVYDLDPDTTTADFENEVTIDNKLSFNEGDEIPLNAEISIVCHRTYEKYTVKVHIDFIANWIFSKYDVDLSINGTHEYTLAHGEDADFEFRWVPGSYTLTFTNSDSSSVKGEVTLDVTGDIEAAYQISCYNDQVDVETLYVENKGAVGENETMVPASASDYRYKNYQYIIDSLEDAGFTNISTEILYDIVWGITEEGESDKVSIGGKTDFKRGDVFAKDIEIIVTYHMSTDDDPEKNEEQVTTEKPEETISIYTIENCEDLKTLITLDRVVDEEQMRSFADKYKRKQIELELITAYVEANPNYKTIFTYLLFVVYDDQVFMAGPAFYFKDVSYYDLHLTGSNIPDSFDIGVHCRVVAKVDGYEDGGILLDPVSIEVIKEY